MTSATIIKNIETSFQRETALPEFRPGDTVKVWVTIREGEKTRLQAFEGVCIRRTSRGARSTFCVRKVSYNVGVERVFADHSPNIDSIEVTSRGKVHQARLYYLRELSGKAARIKARAYDKDKAAAEAGEKKPRANRKNKKKPAATEASA